MNDNYQNCSYQENAYAKINLTLNITGLNQQGMHLIESFVVFADVKDEISFKPAKKLSLTIKGEMAKFIDQEQNSIIKAIRNFEKIIERKIYADITLNKNLPVAAGIGGGSADAAAIIRILHKIYPEGKKKSAKSAAI